MYAWSGGRSQFLTGGRLGGGTRCPMGPPVGRQVPLIRFVPLIRLIPLIRHIPQTCPAGVI
jgi:hypothetical protein